MSIRLSFNDSDRLLIARLNGRGNAIIEALSTKLTALMLRLQQHIVRDKLSGQVLHHRSGKLAGSIVAYPAQAEGSLLVGKVEGASGPAFYGQVHEMGGRGAYDIYPKNKKALAFFSDKWAKVQGGMMLRTSPVLHGRQIRLQMRTGGVRQRAAAVGAFHGQGGFVVKHVHHPPALKRSYMATAAEEMRSQIVEDLGLAMRGASRAA